MTNKLIGREREQAILQQAIQSYESEMVAIIGRRIVCIKNIQQPSFKYSDINIQMR